MSKDKITCMTGKVKGVKGVVGLPDADLAHGLGNAHKRGEVSMHSIGSQAQGRAYYEYLESIRLNNAMEKPLRFIEGIFNPVQKETGRQAGWNPNQFVHHFLEPEKVLGKITSKDGESLPQRVRKFTEKYMADKETSKVDPADFGNRIRTLLLEEVDAFNARFPVDKATEDLKLGKYEALSDALLPYLPKEFRNYQTANEIIAVKNYMDTYVDYWLRGGDIFQKQAKNPLLRMVNTITGTVISSDPAISLYNFHELQKGLAYAVKETGNFSDGMKLYSKALKKQWDNGFFKRNEEFAKEYKTLYGRENRLPRPDNALGRTMTKFENVLQKSDDMLRGFYYQLGKDIAEYKGEANSGVSLGKKAVSDNIYIYDVANKPMFLAGELGTTAYSMMRFMVGQSIQNATYIKNAFKNKDVTSIKALATQMGTFFAMFGVQGTMAALPIAIIGEAILGKDEWKKLSVELDDTMPFLDLNDKVLTAASKAIGGGKVNVSYRTAFADVPFLGVGLSRVNSAKKLLVSDAKKFVEASRSGDVAGMGLFGADMLATVLLSSPRYGSGAGADVIKALKNTWTGTRYTPGKGEMEYEVLVEELQKTLLGSEGD